ncbi:DUF3784 domain-containing protein [uncultured Megasphaera sp.]|uniref:DUF3784 domain-containing protein n=2 Tax=uncultured Megasphaera sp. TaxID=165188 RepID=UPI0025F62653|nr:DUF3784 domain-containing protein [uncultured Megasphaera sp.]
MTVVAINWRYFINEGRIAMHVASIFLGVFFLLAGVLFACGKVHIHLSNWKNMPSEEKEKIDIVPLCRNVGAIIMLSGVIFLIKGLWSGFTGHWFTLTMVAWFMVAGADLLYIEKSRRYQK